MELFTNKQLDLLKTQHRAMYKIAKAVEKETNVPDFATDTLDLLIKLIEENQLREYKIIKTLSQEKK
jgi:hypothetical protein